jgi:hypothetical protein
LIRRDHDNLPTSFIGEAISKASHVIANGGPFRAAYDTNVLDRQYSKEQVFVCSVVPILVVHDDGQ